MGTFGALMGSLPLGLAFLPFSSPTLCLLSAGLRQAMGNCGALMGSLPLGLAFLPLSSLTVCLLSAGLRQAMGTFGALMRSLIAGLAFLPFSSRTLCLLSAGLRQAMGTFGALMGSLIAGLAYTLSGRNYAVTFSLSALPALGALLLVTTVGHLPNCTELYARATGCVVICPIASNMCCMLNRNQLYAQLHQIVC